MNPILDYKSPTATHESNRGIASLALGIIFILLAVGLSKVESKYLLWPWVVFCALGASLGVFWGICALRERNASKATPITGLTISSLALLYVLANYAGRFIYL